MVFGAKRVPKIGASIGKGIREFKRNFGEAERQIGEPEWEARIDRLNGVDPMPRTENAQAELKRLVG